MLTIDSFFSLDHFAHKALWKDGQPVWYPLCFLEEYLSDTNLGNIEIELPEGVYLKNKESISIGKGTVIEPGVYIQGPCVIGEECKISHGAYLRGPLILGNRCHVGHSAELKHSILLDNAKATHFVYVGDSILGNSVNLSAGVKCANLRLDRSEIVVQVNEKKIPTGLKKFGAIVGDSSLIGCNSVLNPGTIFSKESLAHPLSNIIGFVPTHHQVSPKGILPIEKKTIEKLLWQSADFVQK